MKLGRQGAGLFFLIGIFAFFCSAATLPAYTCKMTKETIQIDGVLNEKTWSQADTMNFLENTGGGAIVAPRQKTQAWAAWDSTNFYVAYVTQDNDIKGVYKNHDDPLYNVEAVELFFDADGDATTYIELEWNCYNASWDGLTGQGDQSWTATGMVNAVKLRGTPDKSTDVDTGMTVEVKIPWKALDTNMTRKVSLPPKNNDQMRINFYRIDQRTGVATQDLSAWSPTLNSTFHTPSKFGNIVFSTAVPTSATQKAQGSSICPRLSLQTSAVYPKNVRISYSILNRSNVIMDIRCVSGRLVRTMDLGKQLLGLHDVEWDCRDSRGVDARNGVYCVSLRAGGVVQSATVTLLR